MHRVAAVAQQDCVGPTSVSTSPAFSAAAYLSMIFWKSLTVSAAALPAIAATPAARSMARRWIAEFIEIPPGEASR